MHDASWKTFIYISTSVNGNNDDNNNSDDINIDAEGTRCVSTDLAAADVTERNPRWAKLLLSRIQDKWAEGKPHYHGALYQLRHLRQPPHTSQPGPLGAARRGVALLPFRLSFILNFLDLRLRRCRSGNGMLHLRLCFPNFILYFAFCVCSKLHETSEVISLLFHHVYVFSG